MKGRTLKRHPSERITVTVVIYNAVQGGVPSEQDVIAAIDDMERLYLSCSGGSGHLADGMFKDIKNGGILPPPVTNGDVFPTPNCIRAYSGCGERMRSIFFCHNIPIHQRTGLCQPSVKAELS